MPENLTGPEIRMLRDAIVAAFPGIPLLEAAAKFELDINLVQHVSTATLNQAAFELITHWAEPRGRGRQLAALLLQAQPENPQLASVAQALGVSPKTRLAGPERAVNRLGFTDMQGFTARMTEVQYRVGYVHAPVGFNDQAIGTCLLVGPDLVLTNWHVLRDARALGLAATRVRFDHFPKSAGVEFRLAADPVVDELQYGSPAIETGDDPTVLPGADELDYALLRLADRAADGHPNNAHSSTRGFEVLDVDVPLPAVGDGLIIVQHPDGRPMQVAIEGSGAITELRGDRRVRYVVNTEGGSSGSPCFDHSWRLVALHHWGGPSRPDNPALAVWNQGIPMRTIARKLVERGKLPT